MITGSIASSQQGEPRSTHDIDLVVVLPTQTIGPLLASFPLPDYLLQAEAIQDALRNQSMFNLLSLTEGEKVDFWMFTNDPFDQSRFARKRTISLAGMSVQVSSPEDTILAKLRWSMLSGGSPKQYKDALRVFEVQGNALDLAYLDDWANRLDVSDLWQQIKAEGKQL
jgi:hypothetical protein